MSLSLNGAADITKVFVGKIGKTARALNKAAIKELASDKLEYSFPKATAEDLIRLTSKKIEDTYKRARWVNPKDGKVYHLLEEGRSKEGVNVRILSSEGEFIKNALLPNKTIVIIDQFKSLGGLRNLLKLKFPKFVSHGEIVETYLRRTNPFATIERVEHKKNIFEQIKYRGYLPANLMIKRLQELEKRVQNGENIHYISLSEASMCEIGKLSTQNGIKQKTTIETFLTQENFLTPKILSSINKKGTRIFVSAGNEIDNPKEKVNYLLAIDGVEGVGSLTKQGNKVSVASDSASRNSIFTQHYEQRNFQGRLVKENGKIIGINITGQPGTDLPYNEKNKQLLRPIAGTSYSTPIRVGKVSLNDMMEGIL